MEPFDFEDFNGTELIRHLTEAALTNEETVTRSCKALENTSAHFNKAIAEFNTGASGLAKAIADQVRALVLNEIKTVLAESGNVIAERVTMKLASANERAALACAAYERAANFSVRKVAGLAALFFALLVAGGVIVAKSIMPSVQEVQTLRNEKVRLEQTINRLYQRGGASQISTCEGPDKKSRLCIRVDETAGDYKGKDGGTYRVVYGY